MSDNVLARALGASRICFVICVSDAAQYEKFCMDGLRRLVVPEGIAAEIITISAAESMVDGYEEGRQASDAKYKVYLHQDVEIVNPNFIGDLLSFFSCHEDVGMAGLIGVTHLPENGVWWDCWTEEKRGAVSIDRDGAAPKEMNFAGQMEAAWEEVAAVDGLLLATQYDIPWRADLIRSWHFYDISQCLEYRSHGYMVAVPRQVKPWAIHHEHEKPTYSWLYDWDRQRRIFLREYWEQLSTMTDEEKQIDILVIDDGRGRDSHCFDYLKTISVPTGYKVNISVDAMRWKARNFRLFQERTKGKYRVYIDAGVKIKNSEFLSDLLAVFAVSERIAVVGVGGLRVSTAAGGGKSAVAAGTPMELVDIAMPGLVATSRRVLWDDTRYCGTKFVTESMCLDMARLGYFSVVARQESGREWMSTSEGAICIKTVTAEEILDGEDEILPGALQDMTTRSVINFRGCDRGEIFRKEYEYDWGKIDKRLPENRLEEAPLVSVVMPVWNAEKYIGAAIESVLAQTYQNFELMLVEDCPTDNTSAVVADHAQRDARLRVLKNDRNRGIAYTTNRAIAEAKGKYIALLDDDDLMTPWRLELQVAYLEQHPEIDILGGCTVNIFEDGALANRWYEPPRLGAIHANLLLNMGGFANGTGMIRREFIMKNRLRYRDNALGMQDMKFYMDASPLGRFDTIPDVLLYSRQHGGQETRSAMNGDRAARRAAKYAQFQRESLAANGIFLKPACMNLLNRICDEYHAAVCADERELRQFTAVIEEIYRQAAARKLWFLEEAGACLASRVWEQCNKLGVKEPPKVTPADLPQ